ncbi:MAG: 4-alpha-glucanotransferase, partial [Ktedonobacterales bacterium]
MKWPRASGILVHPTSLPGPFGVGDLGPATCRLLDFLVASKQKLWQVLPLGPTGYGNSPYAGLSAFAGNPVLISPEWLVEDGLLTAGEIAAHPTFLTERVDYGSVVPWKMALLETSFERFRSQADTPIHHDYEAFCAAQQSWLDDYAFFAALKDAHGGVAWVNWEEQLARREPDALAAARERLADSIEFQRYVQFLFYRQWTRVRAAAHE